MKKSVQTIPDNQFPTERIQVIEEEPEQVEEEPLRQVDVMAKLKKSIFDSMTNGETEGIDIQQLEEANYRVATVKKEIDALVEGFFEAKMSKVKDNEAMIVGYKFDPKIRKANEKLDEIQSKVKEQMKTETTQQELAQINQDIQSYTATAGTMRKKLDEAERELALQKQVVSALSEKNKEKKEALNQQNKKNLQLSYRIEEMKTNIDKVREKIEYQKRLKQYQSQMQDSFLKNQESNFRNLANAAFQSKQSANPPPLPKLGKESTNALSDLSLPGGALSGRQKIFDSQFEAQQSTHDGFASQSVSSIFREKTKPRPEPARPKKAVLNHPDVDPTKLTKEQAMEMAGYIQQIEQLEKEHRDMKHQKLKVKEQQNRAQKKHKEEEDIFYQCLRECNSYILRQQELSTYQGSEETNQYFFELYRNQKQQRGVGNPNILTEAQFKGKCSYQMPKGPATSLDGHTNNILYQTIKQIIGKAKREQRLENIQQIKIGWEEFKVFSPIQIIGLYNLIMGAQDQSDQPTAGVSKKL